MPRCPGPGSPGGLSRARLGSCRTLSPPRDTRWHCGVPRPRWRRGCGSSWGHGAMGDGSITGRCGGAGAALRLESPHNPSKATGILRDPVAQGRGPTLPEVGGKQSGHTPGHSCRPVHTPPSLPRCQRTSPSLPLALLAAPAPPAPHFAADPVWQCPRNRRITAGATGPLCQATENAAKISRGQTGGRPTGILPSWPRPALSPEALPSSSWTAGEGGAETWQWGGGP